MEDILQELKAALPYMTEETLYGSALILDAALKLIALEKLRRVKLIVEAQIQLDKQAQQN